MSAKLFKTAAAFALAALCAATAAAAPKKPLKFYNAFEAPFELNGFPWRGPNGELRRLPMSITPDMLFREAESLVWHSAGGEVRFRTSSDRVVLRAELYHVSDMNHMTRNGSAGFVFFTESGRKSEKFQRVVGLSPSQAKQGVGPDGRARLKFTLNLNNGGNLRDITIYMPLYSGVRKMEIGIEEGAKLEPPAPRKIKDPICFYGSSITQGCSASHPGNVYTTLLCRAVDAPQINLGFSSSARGEQCVAQAIAGLKLSAFVMDYDHNAQSLQQLEDTHEAFFKTVRSAQPKLPIIIVSGPRDGSHEPYRQRRDIIKRTYDNAVAAGDKNVYFVDGLSFFDRIPRKFCTVDNTHPTDLGFHLMYLKILPVLRQALGGVEQVN
jgi:hypothetical protein